MTPLLAFALTLVVLFSAAYLIRQYLSGEFADTPEEKRLRGLDGLTDDDWNVRR